MDPSETSYILISSRSTVDLPLPDGPTSAHDVPAGMSSDMPCSTCRSSAAGVSVQTASLVFVMLRGPVLGLWTLAQGEHNQCGTAVSTPAGS